MSELVNAREQYEQLLDRPHDPIPTACMVYVKALEAEVERMKRNMRDTFDALCAMRNDINEYVHLPSLESDLLKGPETSVFCEVVAKAVVEKLATTRKDALEDAAKVADEMPLFVDVGKYKPGTEANCFAAGKHESCTLIAAAIRALVEKEKRG